ncbi:hypothetical protein F8388_026467 [Cannabis sativa]|uniref:eRF1 domain-containing protein n=1 Tax=Cannabis sativa TaxID=3483 RepID=A0A7J6EHE3_CANSA|nr:hypothetical protein F8388_026467 [Cannabis sativa]
MEYDLNNPRVSKNKGTRKVAGTSRQVRKRKCSKCGMYGHDKTTCMKNREENINNSDLDISNGEGAYEDCNIWKNNEHNGVLEEEFAFDENIKCWEDANQRKKETPQTTDVDQHKFDAAYVANERKEKDDTETMRSWRNTDEIRLCQAVKGGKFRAKRFYNQLVEEQEAVYSGNRYIFEMVCTAASRLSEDVKKVVQIRVKSKGPYEASAFVLVVLSFSQLTVLKSVLYRATVELPKKHGRGGQSALRFSRHIMESRHNYVTKTGEKAAELFIDQKTNMPNVAGLVLAALQI